MTAREKTGRRQSRLSRTEYSPHYRDSMTRLLVVGAFDTKAEPLGLLVKSFRGLGVAPITIDTGVFGGDHGCDYPAEAVAGAAGHSLEDLPPLGRAGAVSIMTRGAGRILAQLVDEG